jgi:hypothetical protein
VVLGAGTQQDLGHRQTHQLRVGEPFAATRPSLFGRDDVVVEEHVQCGQEGVEV